MRNLNPATGSTRWLYQADNGNWVLQITVPGCVRQYEVEDLGNGRYNLLYLRGDEVRVYHLARKMGPFCKAEWSCDCPDAQHNRPGQCKHCRGLHNALVSLPF
jgi:hypothetical protein